MSKPKPPIFRLLSYLRPFKGQYLRATLYSILNKLFDIAPEILIGVAIDVVVQQKNSWLAQLGIQGMEMQLILLGVLAFLIWGLESLFEYLYSLNWRNLAQKIQHVLRMETIGHVQKMDQATFDQLRTGNLISILNDDVNQLERFLENGVNQIIQILFSTVTIGLIFFLLAPQIAVWAILPIPVIVAGAFFFQSKLAPKFLDVRLKAGVIASRLTNTLTGMLTIKSLAAEAFEHEEIERVSAEYCQANQETIKLSALVTPVIRIAILFGFLATLIYGGLLTIKGTLSVGIYGMLVFLTQRLLWPLTMLAEVTVNFQRTMASTTRILDLLKIPISIVHKGKPLPRADVKGEIQFKNITFAYDKEHSVFENFSTHIPSGHTVAFVGTTGSGKSTLLKLLFRFYEPSSGSIELDGAPLDVYDIHELRRSIGLVSQDVFLFHGTVAENIAYPERAIPREQIIEAAKLAEAHDFITSLPQGYDTVIGERGQRLSGGQRQRLTIAREIIKNPPILILDEATSAVDNETELAIQKSLDHIIIGRTVIMIAHRLSTVRNADVIHVLQQGKIVESGTHDALLKREEVYAKLWKLQTGQHSETKMFWK
ncbi:MAG: Lipid A export ATP-binding/permease protein MsbA [Chlamydiales bacterium]|nr:Lipid A export ATP-binding/permease protein MsbA [Chlamydiales bacterium]